MQVSLLSSYNIKLIKLFFYNISRLNVFKSLFQEIKGLRKSKILSLFTLAV